MLPRLFPLSASFFKVLSLPQKFNRFYIPGLKLYSLAFIECEKIIIQIVLLKLLVYTFL